MTKGKGQMKVKNLFKEKEKNVQMNLLNLEQRNWLNPISVQKIANELAECREKRLFNQRQYTCEGKN